jgi:Family of unknown function (DUF6343)/Protein of unknown function (DUF3099)
MRSGNEPMTARSPLRLRLGLAIFGAVAAAAAAIVVGLFGHTGLAAVFAALAAVACVNIAVVVLRIRQGPRFQPGRDVPPLEEERLPRPARQPHPLRLVTRKRVYLAMMGVCLLLIVLAWTVIYRYSTTAAVVMSVVALFVPPVAVIIANASSGTSDR